MLVLTARDVEALLPMGDCIDAVEDVFARWGRGEAEPPSVLAVHADGGGFHTKAAVLRTDRHWFAAKTNGNFPGNPDRHGLPSIQGVVVLADADLGTPLAVMDTSRLTAIRTAAATAVAARHLARQDAAVVTLVGCGAQAASHLRALAHVRGLETIRVLDVDRARAEALAERMGGELEVRIEVARDLHAAASTSDITVTCTTSRRPLLRPDDIPRGAFVAGVGADHPCKHELAPELLRGSTLVVDSLEQCRTSGDLHHAIEAGILTPADVHAELGAVVASLVPGRTTDEEIVIFDSTGTALQDIAAASIVYRRAIEAGRGLSVELV